ACWGKTERGLSSKRQPVPHGRLRERTRRDTMGAGVIQPDSPDATGYSRDGWGDREDGVGNRESDMISKRLRLAFACAKWFSISTWKRQSPLLPTSSSERGAK